MITIITDYIVNLLEGISFYFIFYFAVITQNTNPLSLQWIHYIMHYKSALVNNT